MTAGHNLGLAMCGFFGRLAGYELDDGEAFTVLAKSYPEYLDVTKEGRIVLERCPDAGHALRVALGELGPACDLVVAIVKSESYLHQPLSRDEIVGSWRMRERDSSETGLVCPAWQVLDPRPEWPPALALIHPAGERLVCQATVWYRPRYRELGAAAFNRVWREQITPRLC